MYVAMKSIDGPRAELGWRPLVKGLGMPWKGIDVIIEAT